MIVVLCLCWKNTREKHDIAQDFTLDGLIAGTTKVEMIEAAISEEPRHAMRGTKVMS